MNTAAAWERKDQEAAASSPQAEEEKRPSAGSNIASLRELTFKLLHKVQAIGEVHTPDIESGIDFYGEVTRFEIDLIKRALVRTAGHQRRAARLLNLKVTTLNSKIKQYKIRLVGGVDNYPLAATDEIDTRRRA